MSLALKRRAQAVRGFGIAGLMVLTLAAGLCAYQWRTWKRIQGGLGNQELSRESLAAIEQDAGLQRIELAAQVRELPGKRKALETNLVPLDEKSQQTMLLEVLDLAGQCGLQMEEVSPIAKPGTRLSLGPTNATAGRPSAATAAEGSGSRPSFRMQCRARFGAVHEFFRRLSTLRCVVIPLEFDIDNGAQAVVTVQSESEDGCVVESRPANRAVDGTLRFAVVLSL